MTDINTEVNETALVKPKRKSTGKPRPIKFTAKKQKKFLELLASSCNLKQSALAVNMSPSTIYYYKDHDPKFKELLLKTQEEAYETLEAVTLERATNGSKKGIYYNGQKVAEEPVYHDDLAKFMLSFNLPKYSKTTQIELTGKNGGPIELSAAKEKLLGILGVTLEGEFEEE